MVSKNDDFAVFRLRSFFARVRSTVMHHTLGGQISDFDKILKCALGDDGGDPVASIDCFWWHGEERKPNGRKILPVQVSW